MKFLIDPTLLANTIEGLSKLLNEATPNDEVPALVINLPVASKVDEGLSIETIELELILVDFSDLPFIPEAKLEFVKSLLLRLGADEDSELEELEAKSTESYDGDLGWETYEEEVE